MFDKRKAPISQSMKGKEDMEASKPQGASNASILPRAGKSKGEFAGMVKSMPRKQAKYRAIAEGPTHDEKLGQATLELPVYRLGDLWGFTPEACYLSKNRLLCQMVREVFRTFPPEMQKALTFIPKKNGEWVAVATFWRRQLEPVLPRPLYHEFSRLFMAHAARCMLIEGGRKP